MKTVHQLSIDLVYAGKGEISSIYLLDAAVETAVIGAWLAQVPDH